jgi:hypothetical protein
MVLVGSIKVWFADLIDTVPVLPDVRPYILRTLCRFDFEGVEKRSIVEAKYDARSLLDLQNIGDFAFWKSSFVQGYEHQTVVESLGRISYYECFKMTGRRVVAYEVLADELPELTKEIHIRMVAPLTTTQVMHT